MKSYAAHLSKRHHQKATRKGIYKGKKDIQPVPACSYISARFALPVAHTLYLQERYPDKSLSMAIKAYLLETIPPVKEI